MKLSLLIEALKEIQRAANMDLETPVIGVAYGLQEIKTPGCESCIEKKIFIRKEVENER